MIQIIVRRAEGKPDKGSHGHKGHHTQGDGGRRDTVLLPAAPHVFPGDHAAGSEHSADHSRHANLLRPDTDIIQTLNRGDRRHLRRPPGRCPRGQKDCQQRQSHGEQEGRQGNFKTQERSQGALQKRAGHIGENPAGQQAAAHSQRDSHRRQKKSLIVHIFPNLPGRRPQRGQHSVLPHLLCDGDGETVADAEYCGKQNNDNDNRRHGVYKTEAGIAEIQRLIADQILILVETVFQIRPCHILFIVLGADASIFPGLIHLRGNPQYPGNRLIRVPQPLRGKPHKHIHRAGMYHAPVSLVKAGNDRVAGSHTFLHNIVHPLCNTHHPVGLRKDRHKCLLALCIGRRLVQIIPFADSSAHRQGQLVAHLVPYAAVGLDMSGNHNLPLADGRASLDNVQGGLLQGLRIHGHQIEVGFPLILASLQHGISHAGRLKGTLHFPVACEGLRLLLRQVKKRIMIVSAVCLLPQNHTAAEAGRHGCYRGQKSRGQHNTDDRHDRPLSV